MSLTGQVALLATRIGQEVKALSARVTTLESAGGGGGASTGAANTWTQPQTFQSGAAGVTPQVTKGAAGQTADLHRYVDAGGVLQAAIDALGVFRSGGRRIAPLTSRLTSQASTSATTYGPTGLTVSVAAAGVYLIRVVGSYQSAATTTGIGLQFGGTCTVTGLRALVKIWGATATTATAQVQTALAPNAAKSTAVAAASTAYPFEIEGLVRVNAAGTFEVQFASEVAGSAVNVHIDSYLSLQEVA